MCKKGAKMKKLSEFFIGEIGYVKKVYGENRIKRRLFDMGITPGTQIFLRKKAPLGDPIEIKVRDFYLAIRLSDADKIWVKQQTKKP